MENQITLPSAHQHGDAVWLNLWSTAIACEVHAVHFSVSKVHYDLKVFGANGETTRLYRVDSAFVDKVRPDYVNLHESQLVSFGNYLLKKVGAKAHSTDGEAVGLREVSDADLANWKAATGATGGSNGLQVEADENLDQVSVSGEIHIGPPL